MTSDTIWQKFIYNVPLSDDGFPLVHLKKSLNYDVTISLTELFKTNQDKISTLFSKLKRKKILILNNYGYFENDVYLNGIKYYLLAYAYWLAKNNNDVNIQFIDIKKD